MSFAYNQYPGESFSNPTTPLAFPTWETMDNEEQQSQQHQEHTTQPQHVQLQQSDLPSPTGPSAHTPQHQTIQLEEPPHVVPSQTRPVYDDTPVRLHHVLQRPERQRESLRQHEARHPQIIDTHPSSAPTPAVGPIRQPRSSHPQHPYRRTPSASSAAPPSRQQAPTVRFGSVQPSMQPLQMQASSSAMHSPTVPSPAMPSPASATSRLASYGSGIGSPVDTLLLPNLRHEMRRLYLLRTDSHYDIESRKLIVMLEVPGVRKADLRVTLSTCSWNRVKQITVSGVSRPVFPPSPAESADGGPELTIRERKFGEFARTFAVPAETNREDIESFMEDGVLTVRVPCGLPVYPNVEDIPIR